MDMEGTEPAKLLLVLRAYEEHSLSRKQWEEVDTILASLRDAGQQHGSMVQLLDGYPVHGKVIIEGAKHSSGQWAEFGSLVEDYTQITQDLFF